MKSNDNFFEVDEISCKLIITAQHFLFIEPYGEPGDVDIGINLYEC